MPRLRKPTKEKLNSKKEKDDEAEQKPDNTQPTSLISWKKILTRVILSVIMIGLAYWSASKGTEKVFAAQKDNVKHRSHEVPCSKSYTKEISLYKGCIPKKCGRIVTDAIVSESEAAHLLQLAKKGLAFGKPEGGASILDLHSGAISYKNTFINIYKKIKELGIENVFTEQDFNLYKNVRHKIQQMVAFYYGLEVDKLHLTHPTFFSEMTAKVPKSTHDQYWHVHVDKETYPTFHYTSLLYLSDYGIDFSGGRFFFVENPQNMTIEPKLGRVSTFTSGAENPHFVERVTSGVRYALTVAFTCDKEKAIQDPSMSRMN